MTDFTDPSFRGEGRDDPPPRQPTKGPTHDLSDLNIAKGTRIRVLECGRRSIEGYEGVVIQSFPGYVIVELEHDPALHHRLRMAGGFAHQTVQPRRSFRVTEVERV